jgi:membrane protein implicated in regulation of membrane protease activity
MAGWVFWVLAAIVLAVGEMLTLSFFLAPFAGGALLAALVDLWGGGAVLSWIVFIVSSLLFLLVVRPIARSHRRTPTALRTGTAALIGRRAIVVERIANDEAVGAVRIDNGEVWTARAFDDESVIDVGSRVEVVEIRGATALVAE